MLISYLVVGFFADISHGFFPLFRSSFQSFVFFPRKDIYADAKLAGCTIALWLRNRTKRAILSLRRTTSDHPVGVSQYLFSRKNSPFMNMIV